MAKTSAAQAAAMIRKEIKAAFPGLHFGCTSETYSMGSSINITMTDQPATTKAAIEKMTAKYCYGHFNGQEDYYEISNSRDDLPQAKFIFVSNAMSPEKRAEVYAGIRSTWAGGEELPEDYKAAQNIWFTNGNAYISEMVWREFTRAEA